MFIFLLWTVKIHLSRHACTKKLIKALLKKKDMQERSEFKMMEVLNSTQSYSESLLKL